LLKKKRFLKLFEGVERVIPRIDFSWLEGLILGGNVIHASFYFSGCNPDSLLFLVSYTVSTLNFLRLTNRVTEFKKNSFVIRRCILFMAQNIIPFLLIGSILSCIFYSIYHRELLYCLTANSEDIISRHTCQQRGLDLVSYKITFDTYYDSLFTYYVMADRGLWYNILLMIYNSSAVHVLYKVTLWGLVYAVIALVTFLLRGVTLAVCYVSLEKFSSNRMDKNITLTKPQVEWIQTEELFSEMRLLRKLPTPTLILSKWCLIIKESAIWVFIYYFIIIAGFLINFAQ
jgi:hypothetical protein